MLAVNRDQLAKGSLEDITRSNFLREHGIVVEQLGISNASSACPTRSNAVFGWFGVAQELRFGEDQLHALWLFFAAAAAGAPRSSSLPCLASTWP